MTKFGTKNDLLLTPQRLGIGSTFSKGPGFGFSEGPGPSAGLLYKVWRSIQLYDKKYI